MLPLQDVNPNRRFPIFTYALIAINVLVFLWEISLPPDQLQREFVSLAVVPANLARDGFFAKESLLDIGRSMFLHGGWDHIIGNMLYLFLFGDNVEDRFGGILYLVMYFASGFAATFAQYIIEPTSTVPNIGASGAIAGVLGSVPWRKSARAGDVGAVWQPSGKARLGSAGLMVCAATGGRLCLTGNQCAVRRRCGIFRPHWRFRHRDFAHPDFYAGGAAAVRRCTAADALPATAAVTARGFHQFRVTLRRQYFRTKAPPGMAAVSR